MENVHQSFELLATKEQLQMKTVEAFQTRDGKIFATHEEAKHHEMMLSKSDMVEDFLKSAMNKFVASPQKSIARQTVVAWELWKKENVR